MTENLYRKEAVLHRNRSLFGDVILRGPLSTWIVTAILILLMALLLTGLFLFQIQTDDGDMSVFRWLVSQGRS